MSEEKLTPAERAAKLYGFTLKDTGEKTAMEHTCGTGCDHHHPPKASSVSGGGSFYHTSGNFSHEPHAPKGKSNAGWWVAGFVAAVGIGAYLINEYAKPKNKGITPESGEWKDRARQPTTSEDRTL